MAVEDAGAGKAVRGEVVWADHQNKPDVAVNIVRRWYDQDGVDAVFGIGNSGIALAISELTKEKNTVLIDTGSATSDLTGVEMLPQYDLTGPTIHGSSRTAPARRP